jgi:glycosyltransferase involved in cell wall biosynthesis
MRLRVLILTFTYPPNKDGVAGASALMAEGLAARGHRVEVATQWSPERRPPRDSDNPKIHQFKVQGSANIRDPIRGEVAEMKRFIASFEGDIVFCHCLDSAPALIAISEFDKIRAFRVLVSHGYAAHIIDWQAKFPWGLGRWLAWQPFLWRLPSLLRKFDRLVFLSHRADFGRFFDHRVARLIRHRGIRIIPNSVDWKETFLEPSGFLKQHHLEGRLLFLCVANYCERKNQLLALRAYRQARIPDSALVFVGSEFNDYSRRMTELDQQLAPTDPEGKVLLLERLPRDTTQSLLQAMDVFVLSAKQETQPIVLLEAMALGKPFISTNTGCVSELAGGIVVRSQREMIAQLQRIASDGELRIKLGAEGKKDFLAGHRKEVVIEAFASLISEMDVKGCPRVSSAVRLPPFVFFSI